MKEGSTRHLRALRTHWIARTGGTDKRRWSRARNFDDAWSQRHELMAVWIRPGDTVIDLGSGPRTFARHLPEGCDYIPVDMVSRGPGTVVADLNRDPMPDLRGDFVVMSGVLEYIHDVPRFLAGTAGLAARGALSYASVELFPHGRRAHGWVNEYAEPQLREALATAGWEIVEATDWASQHVYHLRSADPDR